MNSERLDDGPQRSRDPAHPRGVPPGATGMHSPATDSPAGRPSAARTPTAGQTSDPPSTSAAPSTSTAPSEAAAPSTAAAATGALRGRAALVTGGAVRLGRAIALRLAAEGAHVAIQFSRSIDAARETLADLGAAGVRTAAVQADFAVDPRSAARHVVDEATFAVGPLDLLVNSAAIFEPGSLATLTPDAWNRHHRINLEAPLWLMQEFAAQLPTDREGDVVNIVDWRGMRPPPGHLAYTLSKAGLVAATRLLAQELAPRIRVNAVAPGAILPAPGSSPDVFARLADRIPLGRTGSPDDIAAAVVYFAAARFITGEVLCVTGGQQL